MLNNPFVLLENVTFAYNNRKLLKNVNLSINPFQSVGIVGDNGIGKSTIVKLILGLISPNHGKVELFGKPTSWKNHYPNLGYIGDPSHNTGELGLPDGILVKEMIECFRLLCEIPSPTDNNKNCSFQELWDLPHGDFFEKLIHLLGIETIYSRDVGRLSNGERKKLMILLALAKQPDLIIADEATEGLDKTAKPMILKIIEEGVKRKKFSLLWISHRWDEIIRLSDVIYELSPSQEERGILKKITPSLFDVNIEFNDDNEIDELINDLRFSLLSTVLTNPVSKKISQLKINISRN